MRSKVDILAEKILLIGFAITAMGLIPVSIMAFFLDLKPPIILIYTALVGATMMAFALFILYPIYEYQNKKK